MDEFEKIMESVEREGAKVSQGLAKMLLDMWKNAKDDLRESTKKARQLSVIAVIASVLAALSFVGCVYLGSIVHKQSGEIDAIQEILEAGVVIEETVTTTTEEVTTQTVEGDSATINNGTWEQYNDNSVNNGGGD